MGIQRRTDPKTSPTAIRTHADTQRPKATGSSHVDTRRDTQIWGPHRASVSRLLLCLGPIWLELDLTCFSGRAGNIKGSSLSFTPLGYADGGALAWLPDCSGGHSSRHEPHSTTPLIFDLGSRSRRGSPERICHPQSLNTQTHPQRHRQTGRKSPCSVLTGIAL